MSSSDELQTWLQKYAAILHRVEPSAVQAAAKLVLGERNLERARRAQAAGDPDGVIISAEAVVVNAADAILARDGFRVRGKTGSHEARSEYPGLPREFANEIRVIDAIRRARNTALYDQVDRVSVSMAADAMRVAEGLLAAARGGTGDRGRV
jgi:hypothetical protein